MLAIACTGSFSGAFTHGFVDFCYLFVCLFARFAIQRVYRCDRWRGKGCPAVIVTGPRNNGKQQRPAVLGESSSCFVGCQSCALLTLDNFLC